MGVTPFYQNLSVTGTLVRKAAGASLAAPEPRHLDHGLLACFVFPQPVMTIARFPISSRRFVRHSRRSSRQPASLLNTTLSLTPGSDLPGHGPLAKGGLCPCAVSTGIPSLPARPAGRSCAPSRLGRGPRRHLLWRSLWAPDPVRRRRRPKEPARAIAAPGGIPPGVNSIRAVRGFAARREVRLALPGGPATGCREGPWLALRRGGRDTMDALRFDLSIVRPPGGKEAAPLERPRSIPPSEAPRRAGMGDLVGGSGDPAAAVA